MKKYAKIITSSLLLALLVCTLIACTFNDGNNINGVGSGNNIGSGNIVDSGNVVHSQMKLVVLYEENAREYTVDLSEAQSFETNKKGLMVILSYLKEQGELTYTAEDSGYGAFLTQVNELKNENGYYIYVYTDVEKDFDVSIYASQITYDGKQFTNSGISASQMTVKDDCTIIITLIKF